MSAQSKRAQREKLKAQGLVPAECWVLPENKQAMKNFELTMRINPCQLTTNTAKK
jgi:hypothetical protein